MHKMTFKQANGHAYLARIGDGYGMAIDGADLAHLNRVIERVHPDQRDDVLRCFYERAAKTMPLANAVTLEALS